jgi:hypothetical protein
MGHGTNIAVNRHAAVNWIERGGVLVSKHNERKPHVEGPGYEHTTMKSDIPEQGNVKSKGSKIVIPGFTILAAVLYVQGRLYHESYLQFLGINPSQFPISPVDAYWYALNALMLMIGKGVPAVLRAYPLVLKSLWGLILAGIVLTVLTWVAEKVGWIEQVKGSMARRWKVTNGEKWEPKQPSIAWVPAVSLIPTLVAPFLFVLVLVVVGIIISVFALPYETLGRKEAQYECRRPASDYQLVLFSGDPNMVSAGKELATARLIQCGPDFCGLIRDGVAFVIPRTSVIRTLGSPIVFPGQRTQHTESTEVPKEQMLCYKPAASDTSDSTNSVKKS